MVVKAIYISGRIDGRTNKGDSDTNAGRKPLGILVTGAIWHLRFGIRYGPSENRETVSLQSRPPHGRRSVQSHRFRHDAIRNELGGKAGARASCARIGYSP